MINLLRKINQEAEKIDFASAAVEALTLSDRVAKTQSPVLDSKNQDVTDILTSRNGSIGLEDKQLFQIKQVAFDWKGEVFAFRIKEKVSAKSALSAISTKGTGVEVALVRLENILDSWDSKASEENKLTNLRIPFLTSAEKWAKEIEQRSQRNQQRSANSDRKTSGTPLRLV